MPPTGEGVVDTSLMGSNGEVTWGCGIRAVTLSGGERSPRAASSGWSAGSDGSPGSLKTWRGDDGSFSDTEWESNKAGAAGVVEAVALGRASVASRTSAASDDAAPGVLADTHGTATSDLQLGEQASQSAGDATEADGENRCRGLPWGKTTRPRASVVLVVRGDAEVEAGSDKGPRELRSAAARATDDGVEGIITIVEGAGTGRTRDGGETIIGGTSMGRGPVGAAASTDMAATFGLDMPDTMGYNARTLVASVDVLRTLRPHGALLAGV